ncbi:hypothetical protein IWZ03DRAFT_417747 [Phyllosticta citriasiana]|uniref:Uncharacterized protein n=1 Tax=Phyllosticta citriasiana TaxID=595635 RepID=A0ABR1KG22_9PEZI
MKTDIWPLTQDPKQESPIARVRATESQTASRWWNTGATAPWNSGQNARNHCTSPYSRRHSFRHRLGTPHYRELFYTSGQYVSEASDFISRGQAYVEHLVSAFNQTSEPEPIIFIHGGGQTGINLLNKPDGNPGWASYFLGKGYEVYIIDQAFRARSPWTPLNSSNTLKAYGARYATSRYTAPERFNL